MARLPSNVLRVRRGAIVKFRIRWTDASGKRRSATYATTEEAKVELAQRLAEASRGEATPPAEAPAPAPPPLTFGAFVRDRWLPTYPAAAGNRQLTIQEKQRHVATHLLPHLGELALGAVAGEALDRLFAALRSKLAPKTVKNIRATLGTILRSASRWGLIARVPELPAVKVPDRAWDFFTAEESARLFAAATDPRERAMFVCAVHSGARWGELRALTWGDLDWQTGQICIRQSMPHNTSVVGPTKSGKERRVPMTATLRAALLAIRDLNHLRGGLVFGRLADGGALTLYAVRERFTRACRKAGLRAIRWHDLRHSFASQLVSAGVPLRQVQEWLGHSTLAMTERYSHLAPGGGEAIRVLDSGPELDPRAAKAGKTE